MVEALYGWDIEMDSYGKEIINIERKFNRKAGFTDLHDRLPEFFSTDPLPTLTQDTVFNVPYDEIDDMLKTRYEK